MVTPRPPTPEGLIGDLTSYEVEHKRLRSSTERFSCLERETQCKSWRGYRKERNRNGIHGTTSGAAKSDSPRRRKWSLI
jgi:hypothetical protein